MRFYHYLANLPAIPTVPKACSKLQVLEIVILSLNMTSNSLPAKRPPGRPPKGTLRIPWKRVRKAALAGATLHAISGMISISIPTLRARCLKHFGVPLSEKLSEWRNSGEAERAIAMHETGISGGPGAVRALENYLPGKGRKGGDTNINLAIGVGAAYGSEGRRLAARWPGVVVVDDLPSALLEPPIVADEADGSPRYATPEEQESARLMELPRALIPENGFELREDSEGNALPFDEDAYRERCRRQEWTAEDQAALDARRAKEVSA